MTRQDKKLIEDIGRAAKRASEGMRAASSPSERTRALDSGKSEIDEVVASTNDGGLWAFAVLIMIFLAVVGIPAIILTNPDIKKRIVNARDPQIEIVNHLELPVDVFFNRRFAGQVGAGSREALVVKSYPVTVSFEAVRRVRPTDGYVFGEPVRGQFVNPLRENTVLHIDNRVGDTSYYYPVLTNKSLYKCEIIINDGYGNERRPGTLYPHEKNIVMGYHTLYSDSNVTLVCESGDGRNRISWWGIRHGTGHSFVEAVQRSSGRLDLVVIIE